MKFITILVVLALALGAANSSIIPGLLGGHLGSTVILGHPHALAHAHGPAAISLAVSPLHGHHIAGPGPVQIVSGHIPSIVAAPHLIAPAHSAVHIAKTRGAVHVAPLAGHLQSVVSANLEPAPGTH